jgi:hypothetical protein
MLVSPGNRATTLVNEAIHLATAMHRVLAKQTNGHFGDGKAGVLVESQSAGREGDAAVAGDVGFVVRAHDARLRWEAAFVIGGKKSSADRRRPDFFAAAINAGT